jgi:hypothetical protein
VDVSGTLHLYSGPRRELFFVFDDDTAQRLIARHKGAFADTNYRRVHISVGNTHFIHDKPRTMSFSKKQTEIKISLCSLGSKDGLGPLTQLYDWFAPTRKRRPAPYGVIGTLERISRSGTRTWELNIQEAFGDSDPLPPGLPRRKRTPSPVRRAWMRRREHQDRDLRRIGRVAEKVALDLALLDYPSPRFDCLWRDRYLDSARPEIRSMGIITDIDVWDNVELAPAGFIEVKAQKVPKKQRDAAPLFYMSKSEWRSYLEARKRGLSYEIWLFQYQDLEDFQADLANIDLIVLKDLRGAKKDPENYRLELDQSAGSRFSLTAS